MAGRASTATSVSPTPAACTAPASSPGSACVTPTGAAISAIKVNARLQFQLQLLQEPPVLCENNLKLFETLLSQI